MLFTRHTALKLPLKVSQRWFFFADYSLGQIFSGLKKYARMIVEQILENLLIASLFKREFSCKT